MLMQMGVEYYKVPTGRHQGIEPIKIELRTAAYMLEQLTEKYNKILVHCTAGIDRSPFVVAYWLSDKIDWALDIDTSFDFNIRKAYSLIKEKRPQIIEHYEWI